MELYSALLFGEINSSVQHLYYRQIKSLSDVISILFSARAHIYEQKRFTQTDLIEQ